jgi:hypothetical protein
MKKFLFMAALLGFAVACGGQKTEDKKAEEAAPAVESVEVVEEVAVAPDAVVEAPEEVKVAPSADIDMEFEANKRKPVVATDIKKSEKEISASLEVSDAKTTTVRPVHTGLTVKK